MNRLPMTAVLLAASLSAATLTACSSPKEGGDAALGHSTATDSAPVDTEGAVKAYRDYYAAAADLARKPGDEAALTRLRSLTSAVLYEERVRGSRGMAQRGQRLQGNPGVPRPKVIDSSSAMDKSPARVVVRDCPTTGPDWKVIDSQGKALPMGVKAPPPWESRVELEQYEGKWVVVKASGDGEQTCTP